MYIRVPSHSGFAGLTGLAEVIGPFEGTFTGTMDGDEKTKATLTAELTHRDSRVSGTIRISPGLKLKFPGVFCGIEPVDTASFAVSGSTTPEDPRQGVVTSSFAEPTTQWPKPITINVSIAGTLINGDKTLRAIVTMSPKNPACGARTFPALDLTRK